jgi:hypothetical protein
VCLKLLRRRARSKEVHEHVLRARVDVPGRINCIRDQVLQSDWFVLVQGAQELENACAGSDVTFCVRVDQRWGSTASLFEDAGDGREGALACCNRIDHLVSRAAQAGIIGPC